MITGQEFEVNRRVYVDFEGISLRRKFLTGLEPELINVMIGKQLSFSWFPIHFLVFTNMILCLTNNWYPCCYYTGSLQIERLGVLTELSAIKGKLYPVGLQ